MRELGGHKVKTWQGHKISQSTNTVCWHLHEALEQSDSETKCNDMTAMEARARVRNFNPYKPVYTTQPRYFIYKP